MCKISVKAIQRKNIKNTAIGKVREKCGHQQSAKPELDIKFK